MILKNKNPKVRQNELLTISTADGICCGDHRCAVLRKYRVVFDRTSVTSISNVVLGGVTYNFSAAILTADETGLAAIVEAIEKAIHQAGYSSGTLLYSVSGNNVTMTTDYSMLVFNSLQGVSFEKYGAKIHGDSYNCDCCDADVNISVVLPTNYAIASPYGANTQTVQIRSDTGKVLASWTSDGSADGSEFNAGGVAATALDAAGLSWTFAGNSLTIMSPPCTVAEAYNLTTTSQIAAATTVGNTLFCLDIVSCQTPTNVRINDAAANGGTDVFNRSVNAVGVCENLGNASIDGRKICLNATALGYSTGQVFTVTITMPDCTDVVLDPVTVNF